MSTFHYLIATNITSILFRGYRCAMVGCHVLVIYLRHKKPLQNGYVLPQVHGHRKFSTEFVATKFTLVGF